MDVEGQFRTVFLDIRDLEAVFRRAIGEIRMRVGSLAETGAADGLAEISVVNVAVHGIHIAARPENPVLVRPVVKIKEGIGKHAVVVHAHRVVPTRDQQAGAGNPLVEKVFLAAVFEDVPLVRINLRTDVIAVLRRAGPDTLQRVVAVLRDFYRIIGNMQDFVLVNRV